MMSFRITSLLVAAVLIGSLAPASAQNVKQQWEEPAPWVTVNGQRVPEGGMPHFIRAETPEQRRERIGMDEDPGINPDPKAVWRRFGRDWNLLRFDAKQVVYTSRPGFVRPIGQLNITGEVYQENEKWVWVWVPHAPKRKTREERAAAEKYKEYPPEQIEYFRKIREDHQILEPADSGKSVRFEESSAGLPASGSWRNSLAVADMNGDGFVDLVAPSQRGAAQGAPSIFLGDGKGGWKRWSTQWPARTNYGSVAVADFNKDRKMDVAVGSHLGGVTIMTGDGNGTFRTVADLKHFATRRVVTTDVDGDGWIDVVALWEGPLSRGRNLKGKGYQNLRAWLNRKKGQEWEGINLSGPREGISGDWLAVANFNGDGRPDFVGSSMYVGQTRIHYLSAKGGKYEPVFDQSALVIPSRATYNAVTAARFSSRNQDDAVIASVRTWPGNLDPTFVPVPELTHAVSLDRISFAGGQPARTPIMRFGEGPIYGLNHGDFDRDGNEDLIFTRPKPREAVLLLGDGRGGFRRARIEGMALPPERNYDVAVADVNGDKRPDVILMFEADTATAFARKNGSIRVFLNRGAE